MATFSICLFERYCQWVMRCNHLSVLRLNSMPEVGGDPCWCTQQIQPLRHSSSIFRSPLLTDFFFSRYVFYAKIVPLSGYISVMSTIPCLSKRLLVCLIYLEDYKKTRGPWTATPALIKVEERRQNQQTFIHAIFFQNHMQFSGERRSLFHQLSKQTPKSPFSWTTS